MSGERKVIFDDRQIASALDVIVSKILDKNKDPGQIALVGIHTCGVFLAERIRQIIVEKTGIEVPIGSLDINLYRDDWSIISQSPIVKTTDISFEVEEKHLILVDDVIYTGRTIRAALDGIIDLGRPKRVQLAVLIDRGGRELPIQADYVGKHVQTAEDETVEVRLNEEDGEERALLLKKPRPPKAIQQTRKG